MDLPASEIEYWRNYYSIYPFPQDREDARTALLAERITNMLGMLIAQNGGKKNYKSISIEKFFFDYLGEEKPAVVTLPNLEEQNAGWSAFKAKYKALKKEGG